MRFIPAPENPDDFFTDNISDSSRSSFSPSQRGHSLSVSPLLLPHPPPSPPSSFTGLIQTHKGDDIEAYSQIHPTTTPSSSSSRAAYNPLQSEVNGHHNNGKGTTNGRNGQLKAMNIGK
jgi:hypothetical protein